MCTAAAGELHDRLTPTRAAVRRNVGGGSTPGVLDPVGVYTDELSLAEEAEERERARPFNTRYAFQDEGTEADYLDYFAQNEERLRSELGGTGRVDEEGNPVQRQLGDTELERRAREHFTATRNEERLRSSRERTRSTQVLSNVARRRAARTQQQIADTGSSAGGQQRVSAPQERGGTLLSSEEERRQTLLGGTI